MDFRSSAAAWVHGMVATGLAVGAQSLAVQEVAAFYEVAS